MTLHKVHVRGFAIRIAVILQKCLNSIKGMRAESMLLEMVKKLRQKLVKIIRKSGEFLKWVMMENISIMQFPS